MKFTKQQMIDIVYEEYDDSFEVISSEIIGQRRWVTEFEVIFKHDGKFYKSIYDMGSTEGQENEPYEYSTDKDGMVEVEEVFPKEVVTIVYVNAKELEDTAG